MVLDGPMTGAAFRAYIEQALTPALQPGDVVVMDNLAAHKMAGIEEAIAAAGANLLYLRVPELSRQCRIRSHLTQKCSSAKIRYGPIRVRYARK